jgi:hypothetical protein
MFFYKSKSLRPHCGTFVTALRYGAAILVGGFFVSSVNASTPPVQPDKATLTVQPAVAAPGVPRIITVRALALENCPPSAALDVSQDADKVAKTNVLIVRVRTPVPQLPLRCSDILVPKEISVSYTPTNAGVVQLIVQSGYSQFRATGSLITTTSASHSAMDISGLWYDPATNGSGVVLQHGFRNSDTAFGTWYLYDQFGLPHWFSMQEGKWNQDGTIWEASLYETQSISPAGCLGGPIGCPAPVTSTRLVGAFRATVSGSDRAGGSPVRIKAEAISPADKVLFSSTLERLTF